MNDLLIALMAHIPSPGAYPQVIEAIAMEYSAHDVALALLEDEKRPSTSYELLDLMNNMARDHNLAGAQLLFNLVRAKSDLSDQELSDLEHRLRRLRQDYLRRERGVYNLLRARLVNLPRTDTVYSDLMTDIADNMKVLEINPARAARNVKHLHVRFEELERTTCKSLNERLKIKTEILESKRQQAAKLAQWADVYGLQALFDDLLQAPETMYSLPGLACLQAPRPKFLEARTVHDACLSLLQSWPVADSEQLSGNISPTSETDFDTQRRFINLLKDYTEPDADVVFNKDELEDFMRSLITLFSPDPDENVQLDIVANATADADRVFWVRLGDSTLTRLVSPGSSLLIAVQAEHVYGERHTLPAPPARGEGETLLYIDPWADSSVSEHSCLNFNARDIIGLLGDPRTRSLFFCRTVLHKIGLVRASEIQTDPGQSILGSFLVTIAKLCGRDAGYQTPIDDMDFRYLVMIALSFVGERNASSELIDSLAYHSGYSIDLFQHLLHVCLQVYRKNQVDFGELTLQSIHQTAHSSAYRDIVAQYIRDCGGLTERELGALQCIIAYYRDEHCWDFEIEDAKIIVNDLNEFTDVDLSALVRKCISIGLVEKASIREQYRLRPSWLSQEVESWEPSTSSR